MKFRKAIFILIIIVSTGVSGYVYLEGYPLLDAFYMTIISLTTVGFKEVHDLSDTGKIFTIFLLLGGIGYVGFFVSNSIAFIVNGELNNIFRERKMDKILTRLKDHVIVCGHGKVGKVVCEQLRTENRNFLIIEKDPEVGRACLKQGMMTIIGDATDENILNISGVGKAQSLITTFNSTADNTFVVLAAKEINEKINVVARGFDESSEKVLYRAGASAVVSPSRIGGKKMVYTACHTPTLDTIVSLLRDKNYDIKFAEAELTQDSHIIGKTLANSNIKKDTDGIMVVAVKPVNAQIIFNPDADIIFSVGDKLIILGTQSQLQKLKKLIGLKSSEIKYIENNKNG